MRSKKLLFLCFIMLLGSTIGAQDIHFTQYNMSPMTLNPALAGKFEGTARIGGIYRGQWASVMNSSSDQYKTPSAWVDAPIIQGFRKRDWVGIGFMLYQDKAGSAGLVHSAAKLGAAYHLGLDKKGNSVLSIGGHYGGEQRKVDKGKLRFEDGLLAAPTSGGYGPSIEDGRVLGNAKYSDIDLGIVFSSRLNKTMDFNIGFSMYHTFKPNYTLLGTSGGTGSPQQGNAKLPRRAIAHGQFNIELNDKWDFSPSFAFQTMSGNDEIMVQGLAGYLFNREKDITLNMGLGYRLSDAINVLLGVKVKDLTVGLAYDINTSDLRTVSNYRGGFEIAANYIIKIYKPAVVKPKVLCPRF